MKLKLIILAVSVILAMASKAQNFNVHMDAGYSVSNGALVGAGVGYNFVAIGLAAGFQTHTSNLVKRGAFLNVGVFHEFQIAEAWYIQPAVSYSYHYKSDDTKGLNSAHPLYSLEIQKEILPDEMRLGFKVARTGNYTLLNFNIVGLF